MSRVMTNDRTHSKQYQKPKRQLTKLQAVVIEKKMNDVNDKKERILIILQISFKLNVDLNSHNFT